MLNATEAMSLKYRATSGAAAAVIWKRLTHLNILPFLGTTIAPLQLISAWMSGSDLQEYIKKNLDADRLKPVGITPIAFIPRLHPSQLSDVAEGLRYLHSCNVVHGGLKGVRDYLKSHFTIPHTPASQIFL